MMMDYLRQQQAKNAPRPAAPAAPAAAPAPPPDSRDSGYWAGVANLKNTRADALAGIGRAGQYATVDRDTGIQRLIKQRTQSLSNEKKGAAGRGLFYSTFLTNRNRDVNTGYDDQEFDVRESFRRGEAERAAQRKAIEDQYGKSDTDFGTAGAQLLAEAIQRQVERDLGAPPPEPAVAASAQSGGGGGSPALHHGHTLAWWAKQKKNGRFLWPDGKYHSREYRGG